MQKRRLGQSQILTAPLVLGGNVFGWTLDEAGSFRILDEFVGAGFDFIDTADVYSNFVPGNVGGESETIIGKWLAQRGNRNRVIIATKVGMRMGPDKRRLVESLYLPGGRGFAAAAADRLHRSLPVALRRCRHAARRDAAGLRGADSPG